MPKTILLMLPLSLAVGQAWAEHAPTELDAIIVTAPHIVRPLHSQIDPQQAAQPVAAPDGAALLKTVPGISVIRKGGASGDPLLRGLGGSRLAILADGDYLYGGCGGRMDPPTAYIFPDAYDKIDIIKGPQSVRYGSALISGAVNFSREQPRFVEAGSKGQLSVLTGSRGRLDAFAEASAGNEQAYVRAMLSHNRGADYHDGDGKAVHSAFERRSETLTAGFTPADYTRISLTADRSRGEAAYADRMMDGSQFDRDAFAFKLEQQALNPWLETVRLQAGRSYVDHIMDNFSLRNGTAAAMRRLSNPDRQTDTAAIEADLALGSYALTVGSNYQFDRHRFRSGTDYADKPFVADQSFVSQGYFIEGSRAIRHGKLLAGWRQDHTRARYDQDAANLASTVQDYRTRAGFARYEGQWGSWQPYIALGHAERTPDYWERNRSKSLRPEQNSQLDLGSRYQHGNWQASVSGYLSRIDDFILIQSDGQARNIDARRYGFEAEASWRLAAQWQARASLAYSRGDNRSDQRPLAQTPPLEGNLGLVWDDGQLAFGGNWRLVAPQRRFAAGQGNIIGSDIAASSGFGVLALHAGWRAGKQWTLTGGIDNVFDKTYAEFVSKAGAMVAGYPQSTRVNEPGRSLWLKLHGKW